MTLRPWIVRAWTPGHVSFVSFVLSLIVLPSHPWNILMNCLEYRSGIFTHTPEQLEIAKEVTVRIQKEHFDPKGQTITTVIEPAGLWWNAEEYHQKYLFNNPTGYQCPTHRLQW